MKEGEGSNVAVDGKDFSEHVGEVNKARNKDKAEEFRQALSLS
jgi:hypothetical protein